MVDFLIAWGIEHAIGVGIGSLSVIIVTWILKKIPSEKIRNAVYKAFFAIGVTISKFFNNWKYTKAFWENTFEPWLIGFLDMLIWAVIHGLFDGLRSDNPADDGE